MEQTNSYDSKEEESKEEKSVSVRVLVVDDEPFNLISAKMLIKANFDIVDVETANSGFECLDICAHILKMKELPLFDFIFMDLNMNKMDGYETTLKLKNLISAFSERGGSNDVQT